MENSEAPLAAWRVYDTAEKLHHLQGDAKRSSAFQYKKQEAIRKLLDSLSESDPLRERLWNLMGINVPAVIDGAVEISPPQTDFIVGLVDAA